MLLKKKKEALKYDSLTNVLKLDKNGDLKTSKTKNADIMTSRINNNKNKLFIKTQRRLNPPNMDVMTVKDSFGNSSINNDL